LLIWFSQQLGEVAQSLRILEPDKIAAVGERPVIAFFVDTRLIRRRRGMVIMLDVDGAIGFFARVIDPSRVGAVTTIDFDRGVEFFARSNAFTLNGEGATRA
jgi:hypothetical protein